MSEKKVNKVKTLDNIILLSDDVPENVRGFLEPLPRELEDVCAQVTFMVKAYFEQPESNLKYGLLVVKVMEFVEDYRDLTSQEKKTVAIRCILEMLQETPDVPEDVKSDLMMTIPGAIESVIRLSKGESLNRDVSGAGVIESAYVVKRAFERVVRYVRDRKYGITEISSNVFMIATEIMFIVGGYPSLTGSQKKSVVTEVFTKLLKEYAKSDTGETVADHFVNSVIQTLPDVIDTLVSVANGDFSINTIVKKCGRCLWLTCFSNKATK